MVFRNNTSNADDTFVVLQFVQRLCRVITERIKQIEVLLKSVGII